MVILGRHDADLVMEEIAVVQACWVEPAPRQLLGAVCRVLGVDSDELA
jgi:hypothetical protein